MRDGQCDRAPGPQRSSPPTMIIKPHGRPRHDQPLPAQGRTSPSRARRCSWSSTAAPHLPGAYSGRSGLSHLRRAAARCSASRGLGAFRTHRAARERSLVCGRWRPRGSGEIWTATADPTLKNPRRRRSRQASPCSPRSGAATGVFGIPNIRCSTTPSSASLSRRIRQTRSLPQAEEDATRPRRSRA